MNLLLFQDQRLAYTLPASDERYHHLRNTLRAELGGWVAIGVVDGPRGLGKVTRMDARAIDLVPEWEPGDLPASSPLSVILGMPRPQTARRVLYDAAAMGVRRLHVVRTRRTGAGYAGSRLWLSGEWLRRLEEGAEQGYTTRIPEVIHHEGVEAAVRVVARDREESGWDRLGLDLYGDVQPLAAWNGHGKADGVVLAIGPEGGWVDGEREILRAAGFHMVHLGPRILRSETAFVAAVAMAQAGLGVVDSASDAVMRHDHRRDRVGNPEGPVGSDGG